MSVESRPARVMASLLLIAALVFVAMAPSNAVQRPRLMPPTVSPTEDGVELFQGIFFGVGPQAKVGMLSSNLDIEPQSGAAHLAPDLTAWIVQRAPTFFEGFGADLRSGDPTVVEAALIDGSRLFRRALEASAQASGDPATKRMLSIVESARDDDVVLLAAIVVVVWRWVTVMTADVRRPSQLTWELWVRDLTRALSAAS